LIESTPATRLFEMTFTTLDVDFTVLEETRRIIFGVPFDRDGRLAEDEYRAIADSHWPDRRRSFDFDGNDFA
jgi:hypothetical protein